jgi:hypothetical protein
MLAVLRQVGDYAVSIGVREFNWFPSLRKALSKVKRHHFAVVIEEAPFGELLRAVDAFQGHAVTAIAFRLSALLLLRSGELRTLKWQWVRLTGADPADRDSRRSHEDREGSHCAARAPGRRTVRAASRAHRGRVGVLLPELCR